MSSSPSAQYAHRFRALASKRGFISFLVFALVSLFVLTLPLSAPAAAGTLLPSGLSIVRSDSNGILLELNTPQYSYSARSVDGVDYVALDVPGWGHTDTVGEPALPTFGTMLAIPLGARPTVKIRQDNTRTEILSAPLLPAPTTRVDYASNVTMPQFAGLTYVPNPQTYAMNALSPESLVTLSDPAQWRSQRYIRVQFHPFQYNPVTRQLVVHEKLRIAISFNLPTHGSSAELGQSVDEGAFEQMLKGAFLNYDAGRSWRKPRPRVSSPEATWAPSATGMWYKVSVSADNIYRVVCSQLASAGINTATMDVRSLQLFDNSVEMPLRVTDSNNNNHCDGSDYFEFYGQALRSKYTDTNVYWLTFGVAAGLRMGVRSGPGTGATRTEYTASLHLEQSQIFVGYLPMIEDADHWYWDQVPNTSTSPAVAYRDYSFTLNNTASSANTATVRVSVAGFTETPHDTRIYVNGTKVAEVFWAGRDVRTITASFASSLLHNGSNTFRVEEGFASPNLIYTDAFDLDYPAAFTAISNKLPVRESGTGARLYQITGFTTNDFDTYDITTPLAVQRIQTTSITSGATFTAKFTDDFAPNRDYLTLTVAQRGTPAGIVLDTNSSWSGTTFGADYIFITPNAFKTNIQPLVNLRTGQGMRVQVVDVQDIYDEFSDGSMTPQAIRDFLAYAYANWVTPKPSYVLLVGNGNFNFKNYPLYSTETNYIPPYMRVVDPWVGEVASDNQLVTLDGDSSLPSIAIGRLPALTTAGVDAMVTKIVNYESSPPSGTWRSTVSFVTDNAFESNGTMDSAGNFFAMSDSIASSAYYMPQPLTANRIYYNPCASCTQPYSTYSTGPLTRAAVLAAINSGRLIVNYVGHGAITAWSENLLNNADAAALTNGTKLPVMLPMTCYEGYFQFPGISSVSEAMVTRSGNGAVASWSPTGLGVATGHDYLDRGFFEAVMEKSVTRVGLAAIAGKINLYTNTSGNLDLLDTFNLLGDPATNMPISVTHITVTPSPTRTRTITPSATASRKPSRTPTITATPTATIRPTSATLVNFSVTANNTSVVRLRWETGSEVAVLGFNVWRRTPKKGGKGEWRSLNRELILAKHPGTLQGDAYVFADKNPGANKKNSYKLEIVHTDGTSEWSEVKTLNLK